MNDIEDFIKDIRKINEKYVENNCNGSLGDNSNNFMIKSGKIPILISAPHAVRQIRKGKIKGAETLTGPIVEILCAKTGSNGIIRTCNLGDDPNSENEGVSLAYKDAILKIIEEKQIGCMIEIHGCKDDYPFEIDVGTNYGLNINSEDEYLRIITEQLRVVGNTTVDCIFDASSETIVSNYINKNSKVPCFQIELCRSLRCDASRLEKLMDSLEIIVNELSQQIEPNKRFDEPAI